jgi:biotin carboxylase
VIRANDPAELDAALERVRAIAGSSGGGAGGRHADVLVESYIPGAEVAVEGLLDAGTLYVLAIFDKPDPLEGPYFEETIYVTPSQHPAEVQHAIERAVADACSAIGLVEGPVHAELRLPPDGPPVVLEAAARSIGGLCARTLRFGAGISLEEVILRHALGLPLGSLERARAASGVMMIPIAAEGVLEAVDGIEDASAVDGVEGVEITIPRGQRVAALPEGDRYLGFIFAAASGPSEVESALRAAFDELRIVIRGDV